MPCGPERAGRPPPNLISSPEAPGRVTRERCVSGRKMTNEEPLPKKRPDAIGLFRRRGHLRKIPLLE
ncbi:hypothetical protein A6R68_04054, partial [Neotoma lepida]